MHSDLKLENLLLETDDPNSLIKVIDFGGSKIFQSSERKKLHKIFGSVLISHFISLSLHILYIYIYIYYLALLFGARGTK